jgi:hypothetical protein
MPSAHRATSEPALPTPGRISFDHALQQTAPHLIAAERAFLASVAGFAELRFWPPAAYVDIEGAPFGHGEGLVTFTDAAWKRSLQKLAREAVKHSSARFALTPAGRDLILRTCQLIEGRAA